MDNLIQLAMQIIFCLLIAALLGAIIGYLFGKMNKCDKDDYDLDLSNKRKELNDYDTEETLSSGIDKTETMVATGIAGVGAVGAGILDSTKDIGSNIEDTLSSDLKKTKSIATEANDNIKDFSQEISAPIIDKDDLDISTSIGQEIGIRPASVEAPTAGEIDDLKEVSGIGLKIEEILNSLGIYYFEQISKWSSENIDWIENYLSVKRRVKKEDWVGQSKLLAAGGHTEFSKKVKSGDNRNY